MRTRLHCLESAHSIVERKIFSKHDISWFHIYAYIVRRPGRNEATVIPWPASKKTSQTSTKSSPPEGSYKGACSNILTGTQVHGATSTFSRACHDQVGPSTVPSRCSRSHSLQGGTTRDIALHPLRSSGRGCESMVSPATPTSSNSSALFGSDDTSFLIALRDTVLPGDISPQESNGEETASCSPPTPSSSGLEPPPCAQPVSKDRKSVV